MTLLYLIGAEAPNGKHLPGDINEVYWGTIAFFVIVGVAVWKAGPAVMQSMQDRTARIEAELDDAKAARAEAEAALTASTADLPDVAEEEAKIREEAQQTAVQLKQDLIAKAEAEAEAVRERGHSDVENLKRQARADLVAEVSLMTRNTAEAVVKEGLDDSSQSELIENYINQVSGMS